MKRSAAVAAGIAAGLGVATAVRSGTVRARLRALASRGAPAVDPLPTHIELPDHLEAYSPVEFAPAASEGLAAGSAAVATPVS